MKIWNDKEVVDLFDMVRICKEKNQSLKEAFKEHARKYNRKTNSVRNYYYHEVDNLMKDARRCENLGIDISQHEKNHFVGFCKDEEEQLFERVEELIQNGNSVRSACLKLSDGNLSKMTRLQNKYQNMRKKIKNDDKIILFKQKLKILSENDINSLVMGLVKLIKKTAVDDFVQRNDFQEKNSNILLKKAYLDLNKKDKQVLQLKNDLANLRDENKKLLANYENKIKDKQQVLKEHLKSQRQKTNLIVKRI